MEYIATDQAPKAIGPYTQAVVHNGLAYLSGQIPLDPSTGQVVDGDIVVQTELTNINGGSAGLRFWIGCSARRTLRIERKTGLNETFEERVRLVRFA